MVVVLPVASRPWITTVEGLGRVGCELLEGSV